MNWRFVNTVFRKEILDTLRDKRTLLMMVGVPIILYPGLLIFAMQIAVVQQQKLDEGTSRVAVTGPDAAVVARWLEANEKISLETPDDPASALEEGKLDAIVVAERVSAALDDGATAGIQLRYDGTEIPSQEASRRVSDAILDQADAILAQRLAARGISEGFIKPIDIKKENVAPPSKTAGTVLGGFLPLIVVMMIALGAFYPAVDLTAGEKERGTFETLLSTPLSTTEIVAGKFCAVFVLAVATGLLNIGSMALGAFFMFKQATAILPAGAKMLEFEIPYGALSMSMLVVLPLALFISALMMSVAVMARSFKEAQNYVSPFFLLLILPAALAVMPMTELGAVSRFVPVYNVILLFKELLRGKAGYEDVFSVLLSTTVYAVLALQLAAWLFQREEVILSEERGLPLSLRRAEFLPRPAMPAAMSMGYYAFMLIVLFYAGSPLQQWRLLPGLALTEWALLLAPTLLLLWYTRINLRSALHLAPLAPGYAAGALLTGISAILLLIQFGAWHNKVLPVPKEMEETLSGLFSGSESWSGFLLILGVVALSPAICEEVLFRGVMLSSLRQRLGPVSAAIVVGMLFGVFHISIYRILPTGLLGILLTYLVIRSGSIFAGMLVHFINNGLAVMFATGRMPEALTKWMQLETADTKGLPAWVLAAAAVTFAVGIVVVEATHRRRGRPAREAE